MFSTGKRWLIVGLSVALTVIVTSMLALNWYLTLGISVVMAIASMVVFKPMERDDTIIDHDNAFISCPNCGTNNPRHDARIYECYNCGRRFSELSGRHPTLPSKVSGSNADD